MTAGDAVSNPQPIRRNTMKQILILLLAACCATELLAANKKAAPAKPAKDRGSVVMGTVTKSGEGEAAVYTLEVSPSEKIGLPVAAAKKFYINLESFVGKRVAVAGGHDDGAKTFKSLTWIKTEAEYNKQSQTSDKKK
jgi:hypothetical protein